ncbi:hypothetical protein K470DRAFT_72859 [Piedraia hortae CBS 480.64]|uniref:Uncharacterized protein n=1 Tax=Piedraia hortae CBS 480.64 TaxID=1314780 RepID=A0A6A7BYH3_9PEZI|nr:hypothetical protein K470DRAFT_72859 [Piedraia hortae CBS 480.64]
MPPRKETARQKETVVYPPSKTKSLPYKPPRPAASAFTTAKTALARTESINTTTSASDIFGATIPTSPIEELDDDPLQQAPPATTKPGFTTASAFNKGIIDNRGFKPPSRTTSNGKAKEKVPKDPPTSTSISLISFDNDANDDDSDKDKSLFTPGQDRKRANSSPSIIFQDSPAATGAALPPPNASGTGIPQPLLIRLLHEHFKNKDTKIDKHAIVVLQRYIDVFVREAMARAAVGKEGEMDIWLEKEDLERIAAGLMLDF